MSELTTRTWTVRDSGHAAGGLAGLHLWLTDDGYDLSTTGADGQKMVLASTGPDPDAAGAPAGARCEAPGPPGWPASCPTKGAAKEQEQALVLVKHWLPPAPDVDRDVALGELARRYLAGHGPSSGRDLTSWAGITLNAARRGLARLQLVGDELVDLPGREVPPPLPSPRLLGPFDELLMAGSRASRCWTGTLPIPVAAP